MAQPKLYILIFPHDVSLQCDFLSRNCGRFIYNWNWNFFSFVGTIPWKEPIVLKNCWFHSMLAAHYHFSPTCNEDGSYGPKQCYLERCWCVNQDGHPQIHDHKHRFFYKLAAMMLVCYQNGPWKLLVFATSSRTAIIL